MMQHRKIRGQTDTLGVGAGFLRAALAPRFDRRTGLWVFACTPPFGAEHTTPHQQKQSKDQRCARRSFICCQKAPCNSCNCCCTWKPAAPHTSHSSTHRSTYPSTHTHKQACWARAARHARSSMRLPAFAQASSLLLLLLASGAAAGAAASSPSGRPRRLPNPCGRSTDRLTDRSTTHLTTAARSSGGGGGGGGKKGGWGLRCDSLLGCSRRQQEQGMATPTPSGASGSSSSARRKRCVGRSGLLLDGCTKAPRPDPESPPQPQPQPTTDRSSARPPSPTPWRRAAAAVRGTARRAAAAAARTTRTTTTTIRTTRSRSSKSSCLWRAAPRPSRAARGWT